MSVKGLAYMSPKQILRIKKQDEKREIFDNFVSELKESLPDIDEKEIREILAENNMKICQITGMTVIIAAAYRAEKRKVLTSLKKKFPDTDYAIICCVAESNEYDLEDSILDLLKKTRNELISKLESEFPVINSSVVKEIAEKNEYNIDKIIPNLINEQRKEMIMSKLEKKFPHIDTFVIKSTAELNNYDVSETIDNLIDYQNNLLEKLYKLFPQCRLSWIKTVAEENNYNFSKTVTDLKGAKSLWRRSI